MSEPKFPFASLAIWLAPLALCLALIGISSASILVVIAEQEIGPNATTCNRLGIAAIAFGLWNGTQWIRHNLTSSLTSSLTGNNSTLLNNMLPIFTTLGAWAVLGRQFSKRFLLGMGVAVVGAIAIAIQDLQVSSGLMGDVAALFAAILSAVNILSVEQLRVQFSAPSIMLWQSLIGGLFPLIVVLLSEDVLFPTSKVGWAAVLGLGLLAQVVGQGLLTYSLKQFSSSLVAVSMLSIPIIS
ncbi:MAG: DMT family transporter, partial [Phormidesmis sp.]